MKLMQVVLSGQPQLADTLSQPEVTQLRQRISTVCGMAPLSASEVTAYINHRIAKAGGTQKNLFEPSAAESIAQASSGIPRMINTLCFNSLCLCRARKARQVNREMVEEAVHDLELPVTRAPKPAPRTVPASAVISVAPVTSVASPTPVAPATSAAAAAPGMPATAEVFQAPEVFATVMPPSNPNARRWLYAAVVLIVACLCVGSARYYMPALRQAVGKVQASGSHSAVTLSSQQAVSSPVMIPEQDATPQPPQTVTVVPGDTLAKIATDHLGTFNGTVLRQIRDLNPGITDPDHIETGRVLRLPGPDGAAARADLPARR